MRAASVTSFLLFAIASCAFAQIGPEVAIAPPHRSASLVSVPRIASNGNGFLAVWSDPRNGGGRIRAARLDGNGNVLDPTGFPIAISEAAAVAPAGSDYLVAFETSNEIDVVIVGSDGSVSPPKKIATASPADGCSRRRRRPRRASRRSDRSTSPAGSR